jgi:NADPH:quinone reductase
MRAAGVSFTDALIRAGTHLGGPKPPFTPGYELAGVIKELGAGCTRLHVGDRIGALSVRGADEERVLVHGSAGRAGTAALELGAVAGLRLIGTASARDRAAVVGLGAMFIDYRNEDFVARVRELTPDGVEVGMDGIAGAVSLRSFGVLRRGDPFRGDPGGRPIVMGNYNTMSQGRKSWRAWIEWYAATAIVTL